MKITDLPNEVFFEVLWHMQYQDLAAFLEVPELAVRTKPFLRLITDNDDFGIESMKGFYQLENHSSSDPYPEYSINIMLEYMGYFEDAEKASRNNKHCKFIFGTLANEMPLNYYEPPGKSARDGVFSLNDPSDFHGYYEVYLFKNSVMVTPHEAISLDGSVKAGTITGPKLDLLRLSIAKEVHPGFFYDLPVSTLLIYNCADQVLDQAIQHCHRQPKLKKLDVVGIGRSPGLKGYYPWHDYGSDIKQATKISGVTFEHLTTLKLMMMHSITDLTLPNVQTLIISTTPDTNDYKVFVDPVVKNINAPAVVKLDFAFFQMVPQVSGLKMPNCKSLEVNFYFDKLDREEDDAPETDQLTYIRNVTPEAYNRVLSLPPSAESIVINDCYQFIDPSTFQNAVNLKITQGDLEHRFGQQPKWTPSAPKLKCLNITASRFMKPQDVLLELPVPFNAPQLEHLKLDGCLESYRYHFPQVIQDHHPNIVSLEISKRPTSGYCAGVPNQGPKFDDFQGVKLPRLHDLSLSGTYISTARRWIATTTKNTLEKFVFTGPTASTEQQASTKSLCKALGYHKNTLVSVIMDIDSCDTDAFESDRHWTPDPIWFEGFKVLQEFNVGFVHELTVKKCPALSTISANLDFVSGTGRGNRVVLKDLPALTRVRVLASKYKSETGEDVEILQGEDDQDLGKIIKCQSGIPPNADISNPYIGSAEHLARIQEVQLEQAEEERYQRAQREQDAAAARRVREGQQGRQAPQPQPVPLPHPDIAFDIPQGGAPAQMRRLAEFLNLQEMMRQAALRGDFDDEDGAFYEEGDPMFLAPDDDDFFDEDGFPRRAFDSDDDGDGEDFAERMAYRQFMEDNDQFW